MVKLSMIAVYKNKIIYFCIIILAIFSFLKICTCLKKTILPQFELKSTDDINIERIYTNYNKNLGDFIYINKENRVYYISDGEKVVIDELKNAEMIFTTFDFIISYNKDKAELFYIDSCKIKKLKEYSDICQISVSKYNTIVILYNDNSCVYYDLNYDNKCLSEYSYNISVDQIAKVDSFDKTAVILTNSNQIYCYGIDLGILQTNSYQYNFYELDTTSIGEITKLKCTEGIFVKNKSEEWFSANCRTSICGNKNTDPLKFFVIKELDNFKDVFSSECYPFDSPMLAISNNNQLYFWGRYIDDKGNPITIYLPTPTNCFIDDIESQIIINCAGKDIVYELR